ncbi:MAG: TolB protein [Chloroflexota bacterium]|nr:TolB protein [Chloroflexota bacterium]
MAIRYRRGMAAWAAVLGMLLTACSGGPAATSGVGPMKVPPSNAPPSDAASTLPSAAASRPAASRAPAEGQIVFVSVEAGRGQIYLERADGTGVKALVASDFDDESPALSPDGRRVAFARNTADGSTALGAYVVNIDGTDLKQIDTNGEDPSWSPDGSQLVETRALFESGAAAPYNVALWIVKTGSGAAHQITRVGVKCPDACANGGQDGEARWSPDGKRLVYLQEMYTSPEQFSIFTMAADGTDRQRLTPVGMNVADPHWSPDGKSVVFQSPPDPSEHAAQDIYSIHADGTGLTQLTAKLPALPSGLEGAFHPSWSPDGRQIVFARFPGSNLDGASLFVMNTDGTDLHLLAPTDLDQNTPEWGPIPAAG